MHLLHSGIAHATHCAIAALTYLCITEAKTLSNVTRVRGRKMAFANTVQTHDVRTGDRFSNVFTNLTARYEAYKVYRKTFAELSDLSDRDLADLGIHRSSLRAIANEAAYGA